MRVIRMATYKKIGNTTFVIGPAVLLCNYLYLKIEKISTSVSDPNVVQQQLVTKCGTTWIGAIVGMVLLFVTMNCLYYFLASGWLWEAP